MASQNFQHSVTPVPRPAGPARRLLLVVLVAALLALAGRAQAAKWHDCPGDPQPLYPSALGATNAPFVHSGHELRILLNDAQVAASGGFAVTPDGNRVEVEIASLYGTPVVFTPRFATAASPGSLTITFPDSLGETGRTLAGPAAIRVLRGDTLVAHIDPRDLVALPPSNDVTALLEGEDAQQVVYGALGANGDLWVPASFHGKDMPMPGCPGDVLMPLRVEIGGAEVQGMVAKRNAPLSRIRRVSLYFGDFTMNGFDFYGAQSPQRIPLTHIAGSRGVSLCLMNDAIDLVLRVKGSRSWARAKRSPFANVVADATPVAMRLRASRPMPDKAQSPWVTADSFGGTCETSPQGERAKNP